MIGVVVLSLVVAGDCVVVRVDDVFPFAGRTVPLNADLRYFGAPDDFVARGPDGAEEALSPTEVAHNVHAA